MSAALTERLVNRLAALGAGARTSRRSFVAAATLSGTALAVDPWGYLTRPQDAYAAVCGPDSSCGAGYTAFCCSINHGNNTCPPNTFAGGWWKADRSSFCGGAARYYIDCNAKPGAQLHCHCNDTNCDHRRVACNIFRYGQCNTDVPGITAVVCRQVSCRPPWQLYPGECGHSSATDNNTRAHSAPCLTKANTYPALRVFAKAPATLWGGHSLEPGQRLTAHNRHTTCVFGHDGNLVVRNQDGVVWQSHTAGKARGGRLHLRHTGELIIYNRRGHPVWSTHHTAPGRNATLQLRNNGRLRIVVHRAAPHTGEVIVWHTKTHTP